jgi:hypothetical protein
MPTKEMTLIFSNAEPSEGASSVALASFPQATAFYTPLVRDYDRLYLQDKLVQDLSFTIFSNETQAAAYVPLYLCRVEGQLEFSYGGRYLRAPLFNVPASSESRNEIEKKVFETIDAMAQKQGASVHRTAIEPAHVLSGNVSGNFLSNYGYQDETTASQIIRLQQDEARLWSSVRKSYRPLINKSAKKYPSFVLDNTNWSHQKCEEYRKLHLLASGRATRSLGTFEKMYEMIRQGQAFLVNITDSSGQLIGAYLFYRFNGNVFYGSSATHPAANPGDGIGHCGIWLAIQYTRSKNDLYFEMGWQPLPEEPNVTDKLRNIALFKSGFGGEKINWFRGTKKFKTSRAD